MKRWYIFVAAATVIAVSAALLYCGARYSANRMLTPFTILTPKSIVKVPISSKTVEYQNTRYGLSIRFPRSFRLDAGEVPTSGFPTDFTSGAQILSALGPDYDYVGDSLFIDVSSDTSDVANCLKVPRYDLSDVTSSSRRLINGIDFMYYEVLSEGASVFQRNHVYKARKWNICIAIDADVGGPDDASAFAISEAIARLDAIAQTVHLTP